MPWWNRFRRWLTNGREGVGRLLKILEREVEPIPSWREDSLKRAAYLPNHWNGAQVSKVVADALVSTGTDSVAAKARELGGSCGFELYCWVHVRFKGVGPEQGQRAFEAVTHPARCKNTAELRDSLSQLFKDIRECEGAWAQL